MNLMKSVILMIVINLCFVFVSIAQTDEVIVIESDQDVIGMQEMQDELNRNKGDDVPTIIEDAMQEAKLDPKIVRLVREHFKESGMAEELMHKPEEIISKTIPVMNEPGHKAPVIDVALHYGTTLTFKNSAGELLFVERYKEGSKDIINIDDGNAKSGEKEVSPYLTLTNEKTYGATNLHVWLVNSRNSLSFYINIVDSPKVYADRIDIVVVNPGETENVSELKLDSYNALTLVLNNRKPHPEAHKVTFNDAAVTGWKKDGKLWLRTTERLIFPSHSPNKALSSDDIYGVNVYQVAEHPMIHLLDKNGNFKEVMVMEESYD